MILARTMSLGARVVFGTAWAMCLVVLGLALMVDGPPVALATGRAPWALLGLASAAAGLFVFMTMVADRLVPHVGRRMTMWRVEMAMVVLLACSVIGAVLLFSGGAPS